jgi:Ni,Fe-hydrogenase I large subunit
MLLSKKSSKCKKVDEIKKLYEVLNKEAEEFFSNFNKEYTDLKVTEINKRKHVSIVKSDYNYGSSLHYHGMEDDNERFLKKKCYIIKRDIKNYKRNLDNILDNYEIIKENIGLELLRNDNKQFKEWILDTQKKMDNLKGEYIWELQ